MQSSAGSSIAAITVIFHRLGESSPLSCSAIGSGFKRKGEKLLRLLFAKPKGKVSKCPRFLIQHSCSIRRNEGFKASRFQPFFVTLQKPRGKVKADERRINEDDSGTLQGFGYTREVVILCKAISSELLRKSFGDFVCLKAFTAVVRRNDIFLVISAEKRLWFSAVSNVLQSPRAISTEAPEKEPCFVATVCFPWNAC